MNSAPERLVLDQADIGRALMRISHEILERLKSPDQLVLMGIPTRGAHLAQRLAESISAIAGADIPWGTVDITLHRDDLRSGPIRALLPTRLPVGGVEGKTVVLVDDVLYSGRTIRAALDALGDLGRPHIVQLAVLIDRGHRELPIRADYVGKNLPTSLRESVRVRLREVDDFDDVAIVDRADGSAQE